MSGMLTCREATQLVSEAMDHKLPLSRTFELKMHMFMCKFCSRFKKQVLSIRHVIQENAHLMDDDVVQDALSPDVKEHLRHLLDREGQD